MKTKRKTDKTSNDCVAAHDGVSLAEVMGFPPNQNGDHGSSLEKRVTVMGVKVPATVADLIISYRGRPVSENKLLRQNGMGPKTLEKLKSAGLKTVKGKKTDRRQIQLGYLRQKELRLLNLQSDVKAWLVNCREQIAKLLK